MYIVFDDLRVAEAALKSFQNVPFPLRGTYDVGFVPYAVYNNECRTSMTPFNGFETQVNVEVLVNLPSTLTTVPVLPGILDLAYKKLSELIYERGDWRTIEWSHNSALAWSLTVEFHSAEHAARFLDKYTEGTRVHLTSDVCHLTIELTWFNC